MIRAAYCRHGWLVGAPSGNCTICRPCVNGRHRPHHLIRQGASCDRPLPAPPLVHRAVGAGAVAAAVGLGTAFVVGWKVADAAVTHGPVLLEVARRRAAERWCEVLG